MLSDYCAKKLYPLQDRVLKLMDQAETLFYLTGGTALSRFYLNHRYSDDLDLFQNDSKTFQDDLDSMLHSLGKQFDVNVTLRSEQFLRLSLSGGDVRFNMEFVNDVPFHLGEFKSFPVFSRVDNIYNILSNKVTAIVTREEIKDIVDVVFVMKNYTVDWKEIFHSAQSKSAGAFPPLVAQKIGEYDLSNLSFIKWVENVDTEEFEKDRDDVVRRIIGIE